MNLTKVNQKFEKLLLLTRREHSQISNYFGTKKYNKFYQEIYSFGIIDIQHVGIHKE